ncbi:MAG: KR domain-containing protein, partial [Actinobacteria bacterium]|nr:KR domain-containing protein [Actinomycetota bacterium]
MSTSVLLVGGFGNLGGRIAHHLAEKSDCNIVLASRTKREAPT